MVRVADLPLMARIGLNPDEMGRRQPLIVSVALAIAPDGRIETLGQSVDYRRIAAEGESLADRHIPMIEAFAWELAERCLMLGPVLRADVSVTKPEALPRGLASVSVTLARDA
jgi:dihydroneopterin aldolase